MSRFPQHRFPPSEFLIKIIQLMKTKTKFILSAVSERDFPESARPEAAFVGRSNVGKSSLINAMVGTRMARVSSRPGVTRAANFFEVDVADRNGPFYPMMVVDLPGYGYARVSKSELRGWAAFIEPYLTFRKRLKLVVVLVDSTIPAQDGDREMIEWLKSAGRPFVVVATKSDKVGSSRRLAEANRLAASFGCRVMPVSATTGDGIDDLWRTVLAACRRDN